jgi:hypothetical protein
MSVTLVPDHHQGQPDKFEVMVAEQVGHGPCGVAATGPPGSGHARLAARIIGHETRHRPVHAKETPSPLPALRADAAGLDRVALEREL